jgi:hypothetical protein
MNTYVLIICLLLLIWSWQVEGFEPLQSYNFTEARCAQLVPSINALDIYSTQFIAFYGDLISQWNQMLSLQAKFIAFRNAYILPTGQIKPSAPTELVREMLHANVELLRFTNVYMRMTSLHTQMTSQILISGTFGNDYNSYGDDNYPGVLEFCNTYKSYINSFHSTRNMYTAITAALHDMQGHVIQDEYDELQTRFSKILEILYAFVPTLPMHVRLGDANY